MGNFQAFSRADEAFMIKMQVHRGLQDIQDMYMCGGLGKTLSDIAAAEPENQPKTNEKRFWPKLGSSDFNIHKDRMIINHTYISPRNNI